MVMFFIFPFLLVAQETGNKKHMEVSLRMIGHEVLLLSGDSTSRILPIVEENEQYRIQFEKEFELNPDELVQIVRRVAMDSDLPQNYFVEVEECETGDVVYSYENNVYDSLKVIPCEARSLPKACYVLVFTSQEELGLSAILYNDGEIDKNNHSTNNGLVFILLSLLIFAILITFYFWKKKQKVNPNYIILGQFQFDKINAQLILKEQRIELTSKEADLLILLYQTVNQTVEREVILNVVWGDEGDYVGRTLDVFISKLRKKLEADPKIKIVNVRGVGYKLVMSE